MTNISCLAHPLLYTLMVTSFVTINIQRSSSMSTIFGVFDDPIAARRVVDELRSSSLKIDDVSIVSRATASGEPISSDEDVSAGEGAAVGAVWGGLVGLAALLIPGIGPFIAFGA